MTYPLISFKQKITPNAGNNTKEYTVNWRGNIVTGISPQGKYLPMFSRLKDKK